ncbi:hypothetical protein LDL77_02585 [Flagellimonas marinaquae]|nr:hypothetical protein LDL77_02585 [Allomuricauda aquimarina]
MQFYFKLSKDVSTNRKTGIGHDFPKILKIVNGKVGLWHNFMNNNSIGN